MLSQPFHHIFVFDLTNRLKHRHACFIKHNRPMQHDRLLMWIGIMSANKQQFWIPWPTANPGTCALQTAARSSRSSMHRPSNSPAPIHADAHELPLVTASECAPEQKLITGTRHGFSGVSAAATRSLLAHLRSN